MFIKKQRDWTYGIQIAGTFLIILLKLLLRNKLMLQLVREGLRNGEKSDFLYFMN